MPTNNLTYRMTNCGKLTFWTQSHGGFFASDSLFWISIECLLGEPTVNFQGCFFRCHQKRGGGGLYDLDNLDKKLFAKTNGEVFEDNWFTRGSGELTCFGGRFWSVWNRNTNLFLQISAWGGYNEMTGVKWKFIFCQQISPVWSNFSEQNILRLWLAGGFCTIKEFCGVFHPSKIVSTQLWNIYKKGSYMKSSY